MIFALVLYPIIDTWLEYRYLIPEPVARTSASAWLYKHPWITSQKKKHQAPHCLRIKSNFNCEVIHASRPRNQTGWQ